VGAELTYDLAWHRGIENTEKRRVRAHIRNSDDMHYKDDAGRATGLDHAKDIGKVFGRISAIAVFATTGCMR